MLNLYGTNTCRKVRKYNRIKPHRIKTRPNDIEDPSLPAISVENGHLILAGFDNVRMAVAHVADVVDAVQELGSRFIVHVLT